MSIQRSNKVDEKGCINHYLQHDSFYIQNFKEVDIEFNGEPYEFNFQLVHWEMMSFSDGTITIDSFIFAMGSKLLINMEKLDSQLGTYKI